MYARRSSFVIRIRWLGDEPQITLQDLKSKQLYEFTSWGALLQTLQELSGSIVKIASEGGSSAREL